MTTNTQTAWAIVQGPEAMPSYLCGFAAWSLDPERALRFPNRDAADVFAQGFLTDPSGVRYEERVFR